MTRKNITKRSNAVLVRNRSWKLFGAVKPTSIEAIRQAAQEAAGKDNDYVRSEHGE